MKLFENNPFTAAEVEYLSENELIEIVPLVPMKAIQLITGEYGPFRPPIKTKVPLWIAVLLKRKLKCDLVNPEWLQEGYLQDKIEQEKSQVGFSDLPFHYIEHAHILLSYAKDNITNAEELRALIKDLKELREKKIQAGLNSLDQHYLQMDGLGLMEINTLKPIFSGGMNGLYKLLKERDED